MDVQDLSVSMDGEPRSLPEDGDEPTWASILGSPRQRRVLSMLRDRSRPLTPDELAAGLVTADPSAVSEAERESVRVDLRHRCLPKLEAAGWIERRSDGFVVDEPLPVERLDLSIPSLRDPEHPSWEEVSVLLARPIRREILSIVADQRERLTVDELAATLRKRGVSSDGGRPLSIALHHVDLPTLADVGVVEYDRDERTVAATDRLSSCIDRLDLDAR